MTNHWDNAVKANADLFTVLEADSWDQNTVLCPYCMKYHTDHSSLFLGTNGGLMLFKCPYCEPKDSTHDLIEKVLDIVTVLTQRLVTLEARLKEVQR